MNQIVNVSRRDFLKAGALAGGGLVLGVFLPGCSTPAKVAGCPGSTVELNAFVRIGSDDTVTVVVNHSEMGQGAYTTIPMIVAEELGADWSKVRYTDAPVAEVYQTPGFGMQITGSSSATRAEWKRLRQVGAAAREMLIAAAAETWKVDPKTCRTENGRVISASGKKLSFGQLAEKASKLTPPEKPALKAEKDFKLVGKDVHRLDTRDKTNGAATFGMDITRPGLLVAVVARPPVFGGRVKSFDADKAKAMPGVRHVIQIVRGVAVVADTFWQAKQARDVLAIEWDDGALATLDSRTQGEQYTEMIRKPGLVARTEGDASGALGQAAKKFEASYDFPYLAHAPMESINCTADVRDDSCEIWMGTQFQTADHKAAVEETGLKPEQVKLHTTLLGGGFGRRGHPDGHATREAVQISKAIKAPVKVIWTREDDMRGGYYMPRSVHSISAALDAAGNPFAWQHCIVSQSLLVGTLFEQYMPGGLDPTGVEGAKEIPYQIPNLQIEWHQAPAGIPVVWLRSVGHLRNAFVVETFLDELAHAAGKDPYEYRRALLGDKHPRYRRVLEYVAEKAGWGTPLPEGVGRGIAVHECYGSFAAHVVEASVGKDRRVKVHRVVAAIDCGPAVNPRNIHAQLEGGAVFGLTCALYGEITFLNGRVRQSNFYDYRMLRMNEMPRIETHIVPSTDPMGGVGEPGVPPVGAALANALFAVTGKRIRQTPVQPPPEEF